MYSRTLREKLSGWSSSLWHGALIRSGSVTITIVAVALLLIAIGWHEHIKGQFGRLKRELKGPAAVSAPTVLPPGGQEPIVLERSTIEGGSAPELLSATFLPGRGMNLLQMKAYIPGKGEVELFASPAATEASSRLSGKGGDANGMESLGLGAAVEAPWAGSIYGFASGGNINTSWTDRPIHLPVDRQSGLTDSRGGLLLRMASSTMKMNVMPDGGEAEAVYEAGNFGNRWPSKTQVTVSAQLSGRLLEMKITARNNGDEPEPIGIGWQPRFAVSNGKRDNLMIRIPSVSKIETRPHTGEPTGKILDVTGTKYDFGGRSGTKLGSLAVNDTFVNLRQAPLDNGPVIELRDATSNYGLRMTILSPSIKAVQVTAPSDGDFVSISPRFNYDDPFGREWGQTDTGMVVLQPGQTAQYRVRLEIFSLSTSAY